MQNCGFCSSFVHSEVQPSFIRFPCNSPALDTPWCHLTLLRAALLFPLSGQKMPPYCGHIFEVTSAPRASLWVYTHYPSLPSVIRTLAHSLIRGRVIVLPRLCLCTWRRGERTCAGAHHALRRQACVTVFSLEGAFKTKREPCALCE